MQDQHAGSNRDWRAPLLVTARRHTRRLVQRSGDRLPRSPQLGLRT